MQKRLFIIPLNFAFNSSLDHRESIFTFTPLAISEASKDLAGEHGKVSP